MANLLQLHIHKKQLESKLNYELVTNSYEIDKVTIINDANGDMFIEGFILSTMPNIDGIGTSEELLQSFEEIINAEGLTGRVNDHGEFSNLWKIHKDVEVIANSIKNSSNNAVDVVKAKYENGKLWVRAKVRKGYEAIVNNFNFFSVEMAADKQKYKKKDNYKVATEGRLFSFILTNNPKVSNAFRTA